MMDVYNQQGIIIKSAPTMFSYKEQAKLLESNDFKVVIFDDRVIGEGAYGKCYLGYLPSDDRMVVIKKIECKDPTYAKKFKADYEKELKNLHAASQKYRREEHSNIVNVEKFSIISAKKNYLCAYLVMEYCQDGDLWQLQRLRKVNKDMFTFGELCTIFRDIINGYEQLFAERILHQDLKPENIFINEGRFKIGDFGLSYKLNDSQYKKSGTQAYNAPEKYLQETVACSAQDIYSLGIIFYKLIFSVHPYYSKEEFEAYFEKRKEQIFGKREELSFEGILRANANKDTKARQREEMVLRSTLFPKFLLSRKVNHKQIPQINVKDQKERETLKAMIDLVIRMISFDANKRPNFHEILKEVSTLALTPEPVKMRTIRSIPDRYRYTIEKESLIEPRPLPFEPLEEEDIKKNKAIYVIHCRTERINVMANLLMDISSIIEKEIKAHNIFNACLHNMVPALRIFGYCLTYHEYLGILSDISDLSQQDLETFYRTRQDYLVNNTKNNKEYFEGELSNCFELRKLPAELAFEVMQKFIQQNLRENFMGEGILLDEGNANCFMLLTVVLDLAKIKRGNFFTVEQILKLKDREKMLVDKFGTFKPSDVHHVLQQNGIVTGLVSCDSDDD